MYRKGTWPETESIRLLQYESVCRNSNILYVYGTILYPFGCPKLLYWYNAVNFRNEYFVNLPVSVMYTEIIACLPFPDM